MSEHLYIIINKQRYEWHGCYSSVLCSIERGCKLGDVRYIKDQLFYVYIIDSGTFLWSIPEVSWIPIQEIGPEWLRDFKQKLFSTKESS